LPAVYAGNDGVFAFNSPFLKGVAFCLLCNDGVFAFNSPFLKGVAFCLSLERQNDGVFIIKFQAVS